MRVKNNSKKANEAIRAYIIDHYHPENFEEGSEEQNATTLEEIAAVILKDLYRVKKCDVIRFRYSWEAAFADYAAGLPSIIDTCYYYNRDPREDLATILDETPEEASKYSRSDAERLLSNLIFRQLVKAAPGIL